MVTMRVDLPSGDYRIRVQDSQTGYPHLEADNFNGNFALYDERGEEYINCSQYLSSEADAGEYDFNITISHPVAQGDGEINKVMTDLSDAYSCNSRMDRTSDCPFEESAVVTTII